MKLFLTTLFVITTLFSVAKTPIVYITKSFFKDLNGKNYIEQYAAIDGGSLYWQKTDNKYQASVQFSILITDTNNNIVYANKYNVLSALKSDSLSKEEFLNLHRFYLAAGVYKFSLELKDNNSPTNNGITRNEKIKIFNYTDSVYFSSITLLQSAIENKDDKNLFVKNGIEMLPYISNFYGDKNDILTFYTEFYNADRFLGFEKLCVAKYFLRDANTKIELLDFFNYSKAKAKSINAFVGKLPLAKLATGSYELVIDLVDNTNRSWARKIYLIKRFNNLSNAVYASNNIAIENTFAGKVFGNDTLIEFIKCLRPIADNTEKLYIDNVRFDTSIVNKQNFFYNFWYTKNKLDPEFVWKEYKVKVNYVNKTYRSISFKGYSSDRGRVYLQYGAPDYVTKFDHEPNTYPYEIWQYNAMEKRTNCRFVFYNPILADNVYPLIHSEAFGEMRNDRWQILISNRDLKNTNVDQLNAPTDRYGNRIQEFFDNPR